MSAAVAAVTIPDERYTWVAGNKFLIVGTIAISASPATYVTGGIAMSLFLPLVKATLTPIIVVIQGINGYIYKYVAGADASTGLLKIFVQDGVSGNPLAEMANATAIPAAVSGDTINFQATFIGMI
jgi:hypothetical protein